MNPCRLSASMLFPLFVASSFAQSGNSDATTQALLNEVRQLRLALERSAVVAPRIQVTLQRIQLQQEQVSRVGRQLEDLRDRLAQAAFDLNRTAGEIKQAESRLAQELDVTRHKAMEDQLRAEKTRLDAAREQQAAEEASQRARESELSGRLRTEQAKLDELNDRLNSLERMLEPVQPKP